MNKFDALTKSPHLSRMTVANIAKKTGKTKRGVKTTLTRRGLKVADYDGTPGERFKSKPLLEMVPKWVVRWTKFFFLILIILPLVAAIFAGLLQS